MIFDFLRDKDVGICLGEVTYVVMQMVKRWAPKPCPLYVNALR